MILFFWTNHTSLIQSFYTIEGEKDEENRGEYTCKREGFGGTRVKREERVERYRTSWKCDLEILEMMKMEENIHVNINMGVHVVGG